MVAIMDIISRRKFISNYSLLLAGLSSGIVEAQPIDISSLDSAPTPRDWTGLYPIAYPDPDIISFDQRFNSYILFNSPIQRLYTGTLWSEGPAWNGVGNYLVWSDIPNNVQKRWLQDDQEVTNFRVPSNNSNGNTFDFQGRQLSAEHGGRRVVRYEYNGEVSIIADQYDGKPLNSPNDLVVHPDGSIWFTDPIYGIRGDYEGNKAESELSGSVYRVDPENGRVQKVTDDIVMPNGLCFSPDYSKLYIADTGADVTRVFTVDGSRLLDGKELFRLVAPGGVRSAADGLRCDIEGNLWCGAAPGVQIVSPEGDQIGMIKLPERCANVCFGGPKRNRLFMTASQSLYSLYVGTKGAHIC
jgi:gluconolactonase